MSVDREVLHEAAGRALLVGFHGVAPGAELRAALGTLRVGGVILFKRNIVDVAQCARLIDACAKAAVGTPLLVAVDQEGGRVARVGAPALRLPPMRTLGALGEPDLVRRAGAVLGRQLASIGFNLNFAPVLDVDTNPENPVIGDRAFGATAEEVVRFAFAFADGLASAGVLACGKHFPGHGDTSTDSHLELPRVTHDRARLDAVELAPFRAARGRLPTLMTAHVVFDALDPGVPATLSRRVTTDLLRKELGYDGVVISDDLEMKAICAYRGIEEAAVAAIRAGCDALLVCSDLALAARSHAALVREAGRDSSFAERLLDAARRVEALARTAAPPDRDPGEVFALVDRTDARALEAEIAARLGERAEI